MKAAIVTVLVFFAGVMGYLLMGLPAFGDPGAVANEKASSYYIENALEDMETPNIVTAILGDYRGYDTFGETVVIFTAGVACLLLLKGLSDENTLQ